jgi:hypothetical protein
MPPQDNHPDDHQASTAPKLLIRSTLTDNGARKLDPATVFYYSPDIGHPPTDPLAVVVDPLTVQAGQPVTLAATVQNISAYGVAQGIVATFSWAKPSLGVLTDITPIGVSEQQEIGAGQADVLICPKLWTPQIVSGSHPCLLVQVRCLLDDNPPAPEHPVLDRRVAQRNVTELEVGVEDITLSLVINNPFSTGVVSSIAIRSWRITGVDSLIGRELSVAPIDLIAHAGDPAVFDHLARNGAHATPSDPVGVQISDIGEYSPFREFDERTQRELRQRQGDVGQILREIDLPSATQRQVVIHVGAQPADGAAYVHHLTQVIDNNIEIGGYTVIARPV